MSPLGALLCMAPATFVENDLASVLEDAVLAVRQAVSARGPRASIRTSNDFSQVRVRPGTFLDLARAPHDSPANCSELVTSRRERSGLVMTTSWLACQAC
jgi:hypothetical protein